MSKKLGQHFLSDKQQLEKIAHYLNVSAGETIIEIGPGHGELTEFITREASKLKETRIVLIEKDESLVPHLQKKFAPFIANGTMDIITGDALIALPRIVSDISNTGKTYKIAGNIPYYITGFLFRIIGELSYKPRTCVFTIQKEVAERASAQPPRMNLLAASIQFWANAELLDIVPKEVFLPPPKVDSAVLRLVTIQETPSVPSAHYYECVKALFKQPRKTIANNLKMLPAYSKLTKNEADKLFDSLKISPSERPQDMHIKSISMLAHLLYNE